MYNSRAAGQLPPHPASCSVMHLSLAWGVLASDRGGPDHNELLSPTDGLLAAQLHHLHAGHVVVPLQ